MAVRHATIPPGIRLGRRLRSGLAIGMAAFTLGTIAAPAARAQNAPTRQRHSRSVAFTILGALAGGLVGFAFGSAAKSSRTTSVIGGAVGGGVFGYFIGREYDQTFAEQFRGVPPLHPTNVAVSLEGDPSSLAVTDSLIAVGGSVGVQLFRNDGQLTALLPRAAGVSGIIAVAVAPRSGWVALGSPVGLYLYPPRSGPGALVREGHVASASAAPERIFVAADARIESVPVTADSAQSWRGITLTSPARDVTLDESRDVLWAVTDSELIALRPADDSVVRLSGVRLESGGRRVAALGNRAAVALGERGVALFDVSDPSHPRALGSWTQARFAYDVSLDAGRMFIAAGPEGVYVVDISGPTPRTIGLARSLGFASTLVSHHGSTFVVDRRTNELRRIASDF